MPLFTSSRLLSAAVLAVSLVGLGYTPPSLAEAADKPAGRWAATAIAMDANAPVTFGPAGCPVAVVGNSVWDVKGYKQLGTLTDKYEGRALSADGKLFAAGSKSPNQTDTTVTVPVGW